MTESQIAKCNAAIHTASVASGAAGAVPIPVADAIPITAAQVTMVLALGKIFDQELTDSAAKGIIGAAASTFIGRNVVKLIPVAGWIASAAVAAGVTEAIGWTVAVDFAKTARKEWDRKRNAQDAADAYAEAEALKSRIDNDSSDMEAEDFSDESKPESPFPPRYTLQAPETKLETHANLNDKIETHVFLEERELLDEKESFHSQNQDYKVADFIINAKNVWEYDLGKNINELYKIELYVKLEEGKVYCVANDDIDNAFIYDI